jgi:hypothetical protein
MSLGINCTQSVYSVGMWNVKHQEGHVERRKAISTVASGLMRSGVVLKHIV